MLFIFGGVHLIPLCHLVLRICFMNAIIWRWFPWEAFLLYRNSIFASGIPGTGWGVWWSEIKASQRASSSEFMLCLAILIIFPTVLMNISAAFKLGKYEVGMVGDSMRSRESFHLWPIEGCIITWYLGLRIAIASTYLVQSRNDFICFCWWYRLSCLTPRPDVLQYNYMPRWTHGSKKINRNCLSGFLGYDMMFDWLLYLLVNDPWGLFPMLHKPFHLLVPSMKKEVIP